MAQADILQSEAYRIETEPYYEAVGNEVRIFEAAYRKHVLEAGVIFDEVASVLHHFLHGLPGR